MELNLHQLEIFLCIARERSFSRAAERLRISQPSVSIQIRNLEDSLEVKLFERLGRRVYLTREGKVVLEHAKKSRRSFQGCKRTSKDSGEFAVDSFQLDAAGCPARLWYHLLWRNSRRSIPRPKFPSKPDAAT